MKILLDWVSKIISFALCIVLFILLFIFLGLNTFKKVVNSDNIAKVVSDIGFEKVIGDDIVNSLYDNAKQYDVDPKIIDGIVNDKEFKKVVGTIIGNITEIIFYGSEEPIINSGEIIKVLNNQIDSIAQSQGITLTPEQRNLIMQSVEIEINNSINNIMVEDSIEKSLEEEFGKEDLATIRFIFNGSLSLVLLILITVLVAIIALFRWSIYRFAIWTGVTTVLTGGLFTLIGFSIEEMFSLYNMSDSLQSLITIFNNYILNTMAITGIITVVIGVIQIIYYQIMKKKKETPILNISY